jgi:putative addiction module killer protein
MNKIRYTAAYRVWYKNLTDIKAQARISIRLGNIKRGVFGKQRSVGNGIFELKIDYGPGYRIYYKKAGIEIVVLLCGGDKSTQSEDIAKAKAILQEIEK